MGQGSSYSESTRHSDAQGTAPLPGGAVKGCGIKNAVQEKRVGLRCSCPLAFAAGCPGLGAAPRCTAAPVAHATRPMRQAFDGGWWASRCDNHAHRVAAAQPTQRTDRPAGHMSLIGPTVPCRLLVQRGTLASHHFIGQPGTCPARKKATHTAAAVPRLADLARVGEQELQYTQQYARQYTKNTEVGRGLRTRGDAAGPPLPPP